jgi:hypothetical protein
MALSSLSHLAMQLLRRRPIRGSPPGKKFYIIAVGDNKPRKPSSAFWQWQAALFVSLAPPTPSHQ